MSSSRPLLVFLLDLVARQTDRLLLSFVSHATQKQIVLDSFKQQTFSHGIQKKTKKELEREEEERKRKQEEV